MLAGAVLALGCTVDGSSGDFGGVPTASASGPSQTVGGSDDDDDESEGEQETESESSGDGTTGGTAGGSTGATMTGGMTGMPMGSTGMPMGSTGMGDAGLEQPLDGMYSECMVPEDCIVPNNVCITINMGAGFCTNMGCSNPAVDCDPTPGGTAVPICFPLELNMMPAMSCALDCSAGQICPTGMACAVLEDGSICG